MQVTYYHDAEDEVIAAAIHYDDQSPGLGDRFLDEFDEALATIQKNPFLSEKVFGDLRRYIVRRFPYSIIYRIQDDELRILAVMHHSRRPGYWQYRLET